MSDSDSKEPARLKSLPTYRNILLPPLPSDQVKLLRTKLSFVPVHRLDDAIQHCWLLHLGGGPQDQDVPTGLGKWQKREMGRCPGVTGLSRQQGRPAKGAVRPQMEPLDPAHHRGKGGGVKEQF